MRESWTGKPSEPTPLPADTPFAVASAGADPEPRTKAGRRLSDYAGAAVKLTKPEAQAKMARLIRADILTIEDEARAQGGPSLELLRDVVQHWDAGDIDHDYDAITGAFDAAREHVRATIGLSGEHRHPTQGGPSGIDVEALAVDLSAALAGLICAKPYQYIDGHLTTVLRVDAGRRIAEWLAARLTAHANTDET